MLTVLTFLAACSTPPPEAPPAPAPEPTPPVAPPAAEVERHLPPPAPEGLQPVDIVGHGLRISLHPPFQVISLEQPGAAPSGAPSLIIAWWDVQDPHVGAARGKVGLYNSTVSARPIPEGAAEVRERNVPQGSKSVVRYQLGETGSFVDLHHTLRGAGGMLTVRPGPTEPIWSMEVDGARTPIESQKMVHSADPTKGPPFEITREIHRPWGPWPE